ncbi:MAG: hypothetical protein A2868_02355 [Candidatus Levybacteria bacterium RIFCSPHIGHO2_01_FULL_40_15b]|nr:MAG: hypothetical protein A2868_02355 [Candidatus Levybacteria bacterium RIFCSPHIGHO2_01_FULL_40_15b]
MKLITVQTKKRDEVVDITGEIQKFLSQQKKESGVCNVFVAHTTCAITTADLDPGTDLDTLEFLRKLVPNIKFRHPHDPGHAPDHILSSIIGPSVSIPFENKKLILGTWQRVVLIELNGPRERSIHISV